MCVCVLCFIAFDFIVFFFSGLLVSFVIVVGSSDDDCLFAFLSFDCLACFHCCCLFLFVCFDLPCALLKVYWLFELLMHCFFWR